MRRVLVAGLLLLGSILGVAAGRSQQADGYDRTVILISFDGWRWDYQTHIPVPNLQRLIARGVRAEALIPAFPSKTFPNHYTIVTGLYPGHHGIVANNIRDAATGRMFTLGSRREIEDPMWWGGDPIWVTAERHDVATAPFLKSGRELPTRS